MQVPLSFEQKQNTIEFLKLKHPSADMWEINVETFILFLPCQPPSSSKAIVEYKTELPETEKMCNGGELYIRKD